MASKQYRHLRGKIPAFTEEPTYQTLVDEKKLEVLGTLDGEDANINRLAAMLVSYERDKKRLYEKYDSETPDAEYEINLYRNALSQLLVKAFGEQGAEEVRLTTGELVSLDDKAILAIKEKEKATEWALANVPELLTVTYKGLTKTQLEKLAEWGKKNKLEISVTLDSQTLTALGRDNAKQGKPTPPGMALTLLTKATVYGLNKNGDSEPEYEKAARREVRESNAK
jgi:hypothetical protein